MEKISLVFQTANLIYSRISPNLMENVNPAIPLQPDISSLRPPDPRRCPSCRKPQTARKPLGIRSLRSTPPAVLRSLGPTSANIVGKTWGGHRNRGRLWEGPNEHQHQPGCFFSAYRGESGENVFRFQHVPTKKNRDWCRSVSIGSSGVTFWSVPTRWDCTKQP